jgi:hypothetical protein
MVRYGAFNCVRESQFGMKAAPVQSLCLRRLSWLS